MNRNWIFIILAGIVEVLWAIGLKYSNSLIGWIGVGLLICLSFFLLSQAIKKVPVATVYTVFTGIGTVGTVIIGMICFNETFSWNKIFFIMILLVGILGLKIVTPDSDKKGEV
ncbi:DMT family transporter [Anaeromicropila herbilytica]|uniref:Multidrug SMR transporter n=1 Tax=Anaeromicropila herbilytica TaxID=2785025 RepID=A0A7R7EN20_9FIRM|nr:multidrug efflux SMR transporter [Anaeromicropila herbilytica]BCN31875.1 multidrug SMR transporter [Anaeromicropila herbilytica]